MPDASSFSAAAAGKVLVSACDLASLDGSGTRPLRLGENALFHLPAVAAVARIARSMDYWDDAEKEVDVSQWLAGSGFSAARVLQVISGNADLPELHLTLNRRSGPGDVESRLSGARSVESNTVACGDSRRKVEIGCKSCQGCTAQRDNEGEMQMSSRLHAVY